MPAMPSRAELELYAVAMPSASHLGVRVEAGVGREPVAREDGFVVGCRGW